MKRGSVFALGLAMMAAGLPGALACGPFFPNRYLDAGAERLLAAPEAVFADELMRLALPGTPRAPEREYREWGPEPGPTAAERTARADAAELGAALLAAGRSEDEAARVAEAYRAARAGGEEAPAGTPTEFALYLRGAVAWKRGEVAAARAAWREVLELSGAERRYRSVWAAYMLGRSYLTLESREKPFGEADEANTPADAAVEAWGWLTRAEQLVSEGCTDTTGLAGEARGWRARLLAERGDFPGATALYLDRLAAGDDTAAQSLRRLARRIVRVAHADAFEACVRDEKTRGLVVAFLLSQGEPTYGYGNGESEWAGRARHWATAIHRAGVVDVRGADRLAWLAYEGGLFGLAEDWLRVARADSAEADWLRSKLALRGGDAAKGAEWLERALREDGLRDGQRKLAWAELGRTRLALDRPAAAFEAFARGGHFEDAAFVGERVLSVEELVLVVDGTAARLDDSEAGDDGVAGGWARHLLARRLVRENQGARALPYMPESVREELAAYLEDVRVGFDSERAAKERAEALWRASRLMRIRGVWLVGSDLDPGWSVWQEAFETDSAAEPRLGVPLLEGGVFAPTAEEQARLRTNPAPGKHAHPRYRAAELAWWASSLMPDQSEETARVLWEAGDWLKHRDPKAAEPFYRALVLRCGKTSIGREAARLRWFPKEIAAADAGSEPVR